VSAPIRVGLSPCPNDTFIFHALFHGLVDYDASRLTPILDDVETLNQWAAESKLEVTKISFHAFGHLRDRYTLLDAGSALGRGCGPLVVVRPDGLERDLSDAKVAIPGKWTSAALLLRLWKPELREENLVEMTFDRILPAVESGEVDAGLIIHESRFTYRGYGLEQRVDLGDWWESEHGYPIPLGGIIARKDLGDAAIAEFDRALRASVEHARANPADSLDYVRQHAQEMEDEVTQAHIGLYVNDFTVSLGDEGHAAVDHLFSVAESSGILPRIS